MKSVHKQPEETELNHNQYITPPAQSQQEMRSRLMALLHQLTPQQRRGIDLIIAAEITGDTIDSLINKNPKTGAPPIMCSHSTYYGTNRQPGWYDDPSFKEALRLSQELNWDLRMSATIKRTREKIILSLPGAADNVIQKQKSKKQDISLRASQDLLNRGSRMTADKSGAIVPVDTSNLTHLMQDIASMEDDELDQFKRNLEAATSGGALGASTPATRSERPTAVDAKPPAKPHAKR